jgi:protein required for attachment to host cells
MSEPAGGAGNGTGEPATRDQGSDRPGRYNDGPFIHRSAVQDTDWHRIGKERFADEVAERLYGLAHRGAFKEVVLIAPPQVLGEMRQKLHKEVGDKVKAEIPNADKPHHRRNRESAPGCLIRSSTMVAIGRWPSTDCPVDLNRPPAGRLITPRMQSRHFARHR